LPTARRSLIARGIDGARDDHRAAVGAQKDLVRGQRLSAVKNEVSCCNLNIATSIQAPSFERGIELTEVAEAVAVDGEAAAAIAGGRCSLDLTCEQAVAARCDLDPARVAPAGIAGNIQQGAAGRPQVARGGAEANEAPGGGLHRVPKVDGVALHPDDCGSAEGQIAVARVSFENARGHVHRGVEAQICSGHRESSPEVACALSGSTGAYRREIDLDVHGIVGYTSGGDEIGR